MKIGTDILAEAIPFARKLGADAQALLGENVRAVSASPGSTLLKPGDSVSGVYFLAAGAVRVHYLDAEGQGGTLYRLAPGESCILATNCLFADMTYPAWAEAEDDGATLLVLDGAAARQLASVDDGFLRALFEQVSTRLFRVLASLEQAIRLPLEARLARLLLDLAGERDEIGLSQERLAGHLGTSREVVSRIMRSFARDGLLESGYGRIRLANRRELLRRSL